MVIDYTNQYYMPLCNLNNQYYTNLGKVAEYDQWKENLYEEWDHIELKQIDNLDNIVIDAGNNIEVFCQVKLPNIDPNSIQVETYYGKISENGIVEDVKVIPMTLIESKEEERKYTYATKITLKTGGEYGYTFRVMPKNEMILEASNLNLVKWITK